VSLTGNDVLAGKGDFYTRHFQPTPREDTLILNMGPQHPSTHGVLRVMLEIDGEYILRAEPVIGYVHRMQEKMGERLDYNQYLPNTARVDYLHPLAWNWAYVGAAEKLLGLEIPERAEYIRVITCELNRISSHLLWWGTYLLDLGAFTPILYAFADREKLADILQRITGSRLTFSLYQIGGCKADMDDRFIRETKEFIEYMRSRFPMYKDLVTDNLILRKRVEGIGRITREECRKYGASGPTVRAAGLDYDVRRTEPYSLYDRFEFNCPVYEDGDALARYMVRMQEMEQSLEIIEQALKQLPDGEIMAPKAPKKPKPPSGEVYHAVESGRGKVGVRLISDGSAVPYRVKLRSPSYSNLSLFPCIAAGTLLADAISILGSLDLVIPEIDR